MATWQTVAVAAEFGQPPSVTANNLNEMSVANYFDVGDAPNDNRHDVYTPEETPSVFGETQTPILEPMTDYADVCNECYRFQLLPVGLIYKSYLAGPREPRIGTTLARGNDRGWVMDSTLGGRMGLFRYGTEGAIFPRGWQLDIEGAAFTLVDIANHSDLETADFRIGVPLTWSNGKTSVKVGYYHISTHVGDEFLIANPGFVRPNYVRDSLVAAIAHHPNVDTRVYFEVGYAVGRGGPVQPLEFQFGAEYSPLEPMWCHGAPFAAINGYLREEIDFGGNLTVQAGWQWRGATSNHLLRTGLSYSNGKSYRFEFYDTHESFLGWGIWVDF